MKQFKFYAVVDQSGGVCSVKHDEHASLKAIFSCLEEAEVAARKSENKKLHVKAVNIIGDENEE